MKRVSILLLSMTFATRPALCQIHIPQAPQPWGYQPVNVPGSQPAMPTINYTGTINQWQNSNNPTPQSLEQDRIHRQREYQELQHDLKDAQQLFPIQYNLPSHLGEKDAQYYSQAYNQLNDMLSGKAGMSLEKAVFIAENAYFGNKLSYDQYEKHIQNIVRFCKLKMKQEKIDPEDNVAKNDLLFRLMSDTLSVKDPATGKVITHYPVHYDFDDPFGDEDWTKMFVTKLMSTNYGQCHSMPLLYLIIAEQIGAKAYLATSPSHTYVKYRSGREWKNVELTNGHMSTDAFVMGSGYIKSQAIKNHLYMDTLSEKQTIAEMMEDLSKGYYIKYGFDDFVLTCLNTALQYYPNSWYGLGQKSDYYTVRFQHIVKQANEKGYTTPQQVLSIPEARNAYNQMHAMYDQIDNIGYEQMPKEAYEDWIKQMDVQKRNQQLDEYRQWQKLNKPTINSLMK